MKLLIATHNIGKLREFRELVQTLPNIGALEITGLSEEGIGLEPEETGLTFEENAILKAKVFAAQSALPTLADDSGLEIDSLDGAPGVQSARYGGTGRGQDARRIALVLEQMKNVTAPQRTARFRCVIAVAMPGGTIETAAGAIEGLITQEPRGEHGFGYDPVFFIPQFGCTMAELDPATKNRISHRAQAMQGALPIVQRLLVSAGGSTYDCPERLPPSRR